MIDCKLKVFASQSRTHVTGTFNEYVQIARDFTKDETVALKFGGYLTEQMSKLTLEKEREISKLNLEKEQAISKLEQAISKLELAKEREMSKLKLELGELTSKVKDKQGELTDCKTRLMKALGVLNLRGAWETYENERSSKKIRYPYISRRDIWEDLLNSSQKFDHCFAQGTKKVDKVISTYAKLCKFIHSPELDVVIIEESKFDDEEICFIKTMLKDLSVKYELWNLGSLVEKYPPDPF